MSLAKRDPVSGLRLYYHATFLQTTRLYYRTQIGITCSSAKGLTKKGLTDRQEKIIMNVINFPGRFTNEIQLSAGVAL